MAMKWIGKWIDRKNSVPVLPGADVVQERNKEPVVTTDNPIFAASEDTLGRTVPATHFVRQILSLDRTNGVVVGVLGPWGSGKTSFVNLARLELEKTGAVNLEFNPWMFSGAQQLVESFFTELSAQLKLRKGLADVGQLLDEYGEAFSSLSWIPILGQVVDGTKAVGKILARRKDGVSGRREKLNAALRSARNPIVVTIDDIDRLTTGEIRDVFKLVRLTANFPNLIYVLAFDRIRVEGALAEQGIPGRDYLEKILQIGVDLPILPDLVLNSQIFKAIDNVIEGPGIVVRFNANLWPDVFVEVIKPLVRNMRDVRRYSAALQGTVKELGDRIELVDLLALEAVRIFLPDVFCQLHSNIDILTSTRDIGPYDRRDEAYFKAKIELLLKAAGPQEDSVKALIRRCFPAAERHIGGSAFGSDWKSGWLRNRRSAHPSILQFYLERTVGEWLRAFTYGEQAWSCMHDRDAFDTFLRSLPPDQVEDVISSLEAFEEDFGLDHVTPAAVVLLNLLPEIPERQRGMFDLGKQMVVGRIIYRLFRGLNDPKLAEGEARKILPMISSLSSKLQLLVAIGHVKGAGHKFISEEDAKTLEKEWRNEVRSTSIQALAKEKDLLRILFYVVQYSDENEPSIALPDSPDLTLALLKSAYSEVKGQAMGSRAVNRSPRLAWTTLAKVCGGEVALANRVRPVVESPSKENEALLLLARKYLDGWRPEEFGGRNEEEADEK